MIGKRGDLFRGGGGIYSGGGGFDPTPAKTGGGDLFRGDLFRGGFDPFPELCGLRFFEAALFSQICI